MTADDILHIDAVRHSPLGVGIHRTPLTAAGHDRFTARDMSLHMTSVGTEHFAPQWLIELRAFDGTVLRTHTTETTRSGEEHGVIAEWMAEQGTYAAVRLPGAYELHGIQHVQTGQWIARWDGKPAQWRDQHQADADADLVANRIRPLRCMDMLADSDWWRQ